MLSSTVATAFEYFGDETSETVKFIKLFDRFLDFLNVRCTSEGFTKCKPDLEPYRDQTWGQIHL